MIVSFVVGGYPYTDESFGGDWLLLPSIVARSICTVAS